MQAPPLLLLLLAAAAAAAVAVQPVAAFTTPWYLQPSATTPPDAQRRWGYTTPSYNNRYTTPYYHHRYTTPYYHHRYTTPYYYNRYTTPYYRSRYTTPYYNNRYTTPYYYTRYTTRSLVAEAASGNWPCGPFEFLDRRSRICRRCPFGELARPFSSQCYQRLPIRTVLADNRPAGAPLDSIDRRRGDGWINSRTAPRELLYIFASPRRPASVERFLIWKRRGDCPSRGSQLRVSVQLPDQKFDASCWTTDRGAYISVACRRQRVMALRLRLPRSARSCWVPAEVEVYGTSARSY